MISDIRLIAFDKFCMCEASSLVLLNLEYCSPMSARLLSRNNKNPITSRDLTDTEILYVFLGPFCLAHSIEGPTSYQTETMLTLFT